LGRTTGRPAFLEVEEANLRPGMRRAVNTGACSPTLSIETSLASGRGRVWGSALSWCMRPPCPAAYHGGTSACDRRARAAAGLLAVSGAPVAAVPVAVAASASASVAASLSAPRWAAVAPGIEFARVEAARYCRRKPGVGVVRLDPARCRLEPYHEAEYPDAGPLGVQGWVDRLPRPSSSTRPLRRGPPAPRDAPARWEAAHVGEAHAMAGAPRLPVPPRPSFPRRRSSTWPSRRAGPCRRYRNAVQCMMLFDGAGEPRVRRSQNVAPLTLLALDEAGRLLVFVTEGATPSGRAHPCCVRQAGGSCGPMALDGGRQATLVVEGNGVSYRSYAPSGGSVSAGDVLRAATTAPGGGGGTGDRCQGLAPPITQGADAHPGEHFSRVDQDSRDDHPGDQRVSPATPRAATARRALPRMR